MRAEARIDTFLKIIGEQWKKDGIDLRFFQFLENRGIPISNGLYHLEEPEILEAIFPDVSKSEYTYWGTYGKDGKGPLKHVLVKDMETDHIEAILKDGKCSPKYKDIFKNELVKRKF